MKKMISVLIVLSIIFLLAGCRNSSEYISDSSGGVLVSYIETVESKIDGETASQDTVSQNSSTVGTSSEQSASSQNSSSNQSNTSKPTNTIKPYTGNLPSLSKGKIPQFSKQQFEICGLWAPREITEEAFKLYKDTGFNIVSFSNHDEQPRSSENQYYLGSKRTKEVLDICKKLDIDVYISYGATWYNRANEGDEYFDVNPFSTHNYYGEYMDMIKGVHIKDEPTKDDMAGISDTALIEDFKKIYPNAKYIVNLLPFYQTAGGYFDSYDEMLEMHGEGIMSKFENPYISVDVYPYSVNNVDDYILYTYNKIAKCAKKYGAETTMILQSSTGCEFLPELSERDIRQQAYLAIAFGADNLQYYCYSVPEEIKYNYCILNPDGTPSKLYDYVKEINGEVQKFASAVLAYDWDRSIGFSGTEEQTFRMSWIEYDENLEKATFNDAKHFENATSTQDLVVSRFVSEEYGESYMFVNFSETVDKNNAVKATLRDCGAVAIYGGEDYSGTPEIVNLDENGNFTLELAYGEGVFIVPLI